MEGWIKSLRTFVIKHDACGGIVLECSRCDWSECVQGECLTEIIESAHCHNIVSLDKTTHDMRGWKSNGF